jgi:hypothetical protein
MSLGCKCDSGLSNTGTPNCVTLQSVTSKLIMIPLEDSTGAKNYLDLTTAPTIASINILINEVDATKRWFPLPQFEKVELPKADSTFEEAPSGKKVFIKQGKRSFSGEIWNGANQLLGKIQDNRCVEFGVYIVDVTGNLIGSKVGTKLYPIPVDNQSFDAQMMYATDTTAQKIMVSFDFYRLFDESSMWLITGNELGGDFNAFDGLLDIVPSKISSTTTTLVIDANLDYGTAINPIKVLGLLVGDFTLKNTTTGAAIAISAISTGSGANANRYTLTIASQVLGTLVTLKIQKTGYVGVLDTTI